MEAATDWLITPYPEGSLGRLTGASWVIKQTQSPTLHLLRVESRKRLFQHCRRGAVSL